MRDSPLINQRSELIAASASSQQIKVEDRLLGIGKIWQEKKVKQSQDLSSQPPASFRSQQSVKSFERRVKESIEKKEVLLEQLRRKYEEEQRYNTGLSKNPSHKSLRETQAEFEQRLKHYEEQKKRKQDEMLSEQLNRYSFNPDINPTSKRLASNSRERTSPLAVSKAKY